MNITINNALAPIFIMTKQINLLRIKIMGKHLNMGTGELYRKRVMEFKDFALFELYVH